MKFSPSFNTIALTFYSLIIYLLSTTNALGQIIPDSSLGKQSSIVKQLDQFQSLIEGGVSLSDNLFHSFQEFNIQTGESVYFTNPEGINNILTRVTGGNQSQIFGNLGVNGDANFFLLNPNGFLFGKNATLDINGSFTLTTGEISFGNNGVFSVDSLPQGNLLNVQPQATFNNLRNQITNRANLVVNDGQNIVLLANQVLNTGNLSALEGKIQLQGNKITIADNAFIDVSGNEGGDIIVQGENIQIQDSQLLAGIAEGKGSLSADAGNISLDATQTLQIVNSFLFNDINDNSVGNTGKIRLQAKNLLVDDSLVTTEIKGQGTSQGIEINAFELSLINGSKLAAIVSEEGEGKGGEIVINAEESIEIDQSNLSAETESKADAGNINITTRRLVLQNEGEITTGTEDEGKGADIVINAQESIAIDQSELTAETEGEGDAGNINLTTARLILQNQAEINTATESEGEGGNILVNARESIAIRNNSELSAETEGEGGAGDINLFTNQLRLRNESEINTASLAEGEGGDIVISAGEKIKIDNSELSAETEGEGDAGNINLVTSQLIVQNQGEITTATENLGAGGDIIINADKSILITDSTLFANTFSDEEIVSEGIRATGDAGNVKITTRELFLTQASEISTATDSTGIGGNIIFNVDNVIFEEGSRLSTTTLADSQAGRIELTLQNSLQLDGKNTGIFANTETASSGRGGIILINSPNLNLSNQASISVSSQGEGIGGEISLDTQQLVIDNASITAQTLSSDGGNLFINASESFFLLDSGQISTTAGTALTGGNGGNINLNSPLIFSFPAQPLNAITANAFLGRGGNIQINTNTIFGSKFLVISASSQLGLDGLVIINDFDADPTSGLILIAPNFVDVEGLIAQNPCAIADDKIAGGSSFIITGKGGLLAGVQETKSNDYWLLEWANPDSEDLLNNIQLNQPVVNHWLEDHEQRIMLANFYSMNSCRKQ